MASSDRFAEEVAQLLKRRQVYSNPRDFAKKIGLLAHAHKEQALHLLSEMIALAKRKRDDHGGRMYKDYLHKLAWALDDYQLRDRSWISSNVFPLPPLQKRKPQDVATKVCRDIRLQDPKFPVQHSEVTRSDDELLFSPTSPAKGVEVDSDLGSGPDISIGSPSPKKKKSSKPERAVSPEVAPERVVSPEVATSSQLERVVGPEVEPERVVSPEVATSRQTERVSQTERVVSPEVAATASTSERVVSPEPATVPPPARVVTIQEATFSRRSRVVSPSTSSKPTPKRYPETNRSVERTAKKTKTGAEGLRINVKAVKTRSVQTSDRFQRRKANANCLVPDCDAREVRFMKMHAVNDHIPGIFDLRLPADSEFVLRRRVQALLQAIHWISGRPGTLQDLVNRVSEEPLFQRLANTNISDEQVAAMDSLCQHLGEPRPGIFQLCPMNREAVLIHWRVLHLIAALLTPSDRSSWRSLFSRPGDDELRPEREEPVEEELVVEENPMVDAVPVYPDAVDSHFHLDRLGADAGFGHLPIHEALDSSGVEEQKRVNLVAVVANFCDPDTFPTDKRLAEFPPEVIVTAGVHPKHARRSSHYIQEAVSKLQHLLRNPRVVAVGECGLDHSVPDKDWPAQNKLLKLILPYIEPHHVVVIHCRGITGDDGLEAYCLLRHLLGQLPQTQRFHLHSFMGNPMTVTAWMKAFPNTWFSFNRSVQNFNPEQIEALVSLDGDRILLETDAPYFRRGREKYSMPNQLYDVAEMVASHRGVDVGKILTDTKCNALALYCRD